MKKIAMIVAAMVCAMTALASNDEAQTAKKERIKEHLQNHYHLFGFIRNYLTVDTRNSKTVSDGLYYYMPLDQEFNEYGEDLNQECSFNYLVFTSRVGLNVDGYAVKNTKFGAKVEADFACKNGTTATFRLRQAYATLLWDSLRIANNKLASVQLLVGQAWHPLVTGVPTMCSFETGVPFDNNNRSPQLTMTATFNNKFVLTAALVTQMQYTSNGPEGASVNYMKYACTPEAFLAFTYKNKGFKAEVGADLLSIKPRHRGYNSDSVMVKVSDRITTVSPFLHLEYNYKLFTVMARTQYSSAGEHINVMSGYAVSQKFDDGHWEYTPLHCSSSWLSLCLGKTYQGALFLGYIKNFGTNVSVTDIKDVYLSANTFVNMNQMYRIIPTFMYNLKKFTIGVEYDYTAVQYGDKKSFDKNEALCKGNLHWVDNHRFVCMVKYNF